MIGPCVILTSSNTQTEIQVLSSFVKYVEKRTMLNQNKKRQIYFWAQNLENSWVFFVKRSLNAPTGVDRRNQKG